MWLKYRHKFSHGPGEWEWYDLRGEPVPTALEELARHYDFSDKYRGIDWKLHKKPPRKVLLQIIEHTTDQITNLSKYLSGLHKLKRLLKRLDA